MTAKPDSNRSYASSDIEATVSLHLRDYLPYHLTILSNYLAVALNRIYGEKLGLSVAEWRVLGLLVSEGAMTAAEISMAANLDQVAIHRAASSLLGRKLVSRSVDVVDRRRKPLSVTAQGRSVFGEIVPFALELQEALLKSLSKDEEKQLWALVKRLTANIANAELK